MTRATFTVELELEITGTFTPAMRSTHDDPGYEATVEDIEIEGVTADIYRSGNVRAIVAINILKGVDTTNPEVRKLLANIVAAHEAEMADALLGEVG